MFSLALDCDFPFESSTGRTTSSVGGRLRTRTRLRFSTTDFQSETFLNTRVARDDSTDILQDTLQENLNTRKLEYLQKPFKLGREIPLLLHCDDESFLTTSWKFLDCAHKGVDMFPGGKSVGELNVPLHHDLKNVKTVKSVRRRRKKKRKRKGAPDTVTPPTEGNDGNNASPTVICPHPQQGQCHVAGNHPLETPPLIATSNKRSPIASWETNLAESPLPVAIGSSLADTVRRLCSPFSLKLSFKAAPPSSFKSMEKQELHEQQTVNEICLNI